MHAKVKTIKGMHPTMTKRLAARIKSFNEMKSEGGSGNSIMVRNGFGKLDCHHRPGSQKR